jgi:hypothetical protein
MANVKITTRLGREPGDHLSFNGVLQSERKRCSSLGPLALDAREIQSSFIIFFPTMYLFGFGFV